MFQAPARILYVWPSRDYYNNAVRACASISYLIDEGTIEDKGLRQFIEENVKCVNDVVIREGEPSLHLELNNGDHNYVDSSACQAV